MQDWDICVLTASDERQAEMYRRQLDWRREGGLLPHGMQTLVLPDPGGRRIGSGGATLNALAQVAGLVAESDSGRLETLQRVLLIHSGGDSKRLPHCSAAGKLFARVPRVLPDGRASTIFDEFLIGLSGLATQLPPGVLIASGDVLLVFDHLQLSGAFRRPGVIGVAAAVEAEMGRNHGVYVSGDGGHRVHAYLHKPSAEELARWEAVNDDGTVQIDTGLVWLDAPTAEKFVALSQNPAVTRATLNLYGDLLMPLSGSTGLEQYSGGHQRWASHPGSAGRAPRDLGAPARHAVRRGAAAARGLRTLRLIARILAHDRRGSGVGRPVRLGRAGRRVYPFPRRIRGGPGSGRPHPDQRRSGFPLSRRPKTWGRLCQQRRGGLRVSR